MVDLTREYFIEHTFTQGLLRLRARVLEEKQRYQLIGVAVSQGYLESKREQEGREGIPDYTESNRIIDLVQEAKTIARVLHRLVTRLEKGETLADLMETIPEEQEPTPRKDLPYRRIGNILASTELDNLSIGREVESNFFPEREEYDHNYRKTLEAHNRLSYNHSDQAEIKRDRLVAKRFLEEESLIRRALISALRRRN